MVDRTIVAPLQIDANRAIAFRAQTARQCGIAGREALAYAAERR
jgi:hypothetical protein